MTNKKFDVILCDPPWAFSTWSPKGQGRAPNYKQMKLNDILQLPVGDLANDNCVLFLWTLGWLPPDYIAALLDSWGFTYKTKAFEWWKVTRSTGKPRIAKGYYTRATGESCILVVKGKMPVEPRNRPPQAIVSFPEKHSQKPAEACEKIERMYPGRSYLELFARSRYSDKWSVWGEEVESDIIFPQSALDKELAMGQTTFLEEEDG